MTKEPRQILSSLPGVDFVEMHDADRCAGGAGTYLVKDYDTSQKIFERKARNIEQSGANVVATSCPACMIQLNNGLGDRSKSNMSRRCFKKPIKQPIVKRAELCLPIMYRCTAFLRRYRH